MLNLIRRILPLLVVSLMLIEVPALVMSQTTTTSYPASTSITFISFQGNDAGGVLAFEHNQIAFYAQPLPPSMYTSLPPGAKAYLFPNGIYDVLVNPLNTTFGFNPFQFQEVRFALNYIVNREYFVDQILQGYGIPGVTPYVGDPPMAYILPWTAQYYGIHYNLTYANETIYKALTAHGAQYINGKWYYNGKPITVYVFVRTDDPIRQTYAGYLISQLEKLGFTVQQIPGNEQKERSMVYGSDPATAGWDIDIEFHQGYFAIIGGWIAIAYYTNLWGTSPFTSSYALSWGSFNDTKYQSPQLLQEADEIANISKQLGKMIYLDPYFQTLGKMVNLGVQMAVRITLGQSFTPMYALPNIEGIYPTYAFNTLLSYQTFLAIKNGTYPNVTIGVKYLAQGSLNPIDGYDEYSSLILYGLSAPADLPIPGTASTYPFIFTFKLVNMSPTPTIPVPTDALWWNPEKQEITHVPPNTTAQDAIIYNFAPLIYNDKWVDGQNITLADIIYMYIIASEIALNSSSPIYDSVVSASWSGALKSIKGFKIINSTSIEIWGNAWSFGDILGVVDPIIQSFNPYPMYTFGYMPWQLYTAMAQAVAQGKAAWTQTTAQKKGIDWLSLVSPTDVQYILSALENDSTNDYMPKSLLEVENLSGITLVTPQQAEAGYQAAINFIKTYGHAWISDGPFVLAEWQPSVSPPYAKFVKNPYFDLTPPSILMAEPAIYTVSFVPPATVYPGETLNMTLMETPAGTSKPIPGANVTVYYALISSNNTVVLLNKTVSGANGEFTITLPSTLTPGAYTLWAGAFTFESVLITPEAFSLVIVPAATTTTTSTTTTAPATTTSTTTSTVSTTSAGATATSTATSGFSGTALIVTVVVVIIIIIVGGVILGIRRRK